MVMMVNGIKHNVNIIFCDIGYYFDHHLKECAKECKYSENIKAFIIHQKDYNKEFIIEKNMTYTFMLYNFEGYYYFFETSENQIGDFPKFFVSIFSYRFEINNNKNNGYKINIKAINKNINPNINFILYYVSSLKLIDIFFNKEKKMYFFQSIEDYIFYLKRILNTSSKTIKLANYTNNMVYEDFLKIDNKYFKEYNGDMLFLKKNDLYFIYLESSEYEQFNFYLTPLRKENEIIDFSSKEDIVLYLEKNKTYIVDSKNINEYNGMIKLDRKTINSEIIIKEKNIKLNSDKLFYEFEAGFGRLTLEIKNENALIEISRKCVEESSIIDINENNLKFNLTKRFNFIKIPQEYSSKIINFKLEGKENLIINIDPTYTKAYYCLYDYMIIEDNAILSNNYNFNITNHYKENITLMEDEYYYVIIQTLKGLSLTLTIEDNPEEADKDKKNTNDHKTLWIIFISIGVFILIILIIFIIIAKRKKKKESLDFLKEDIGKESFELGDKDDDKETKK